MRVPASKLIAFEELSPLSSDLHRQQLRIVSTNGCFDLLHLGHIRCLNQARTMGDVLVVAVNTDTSVKRLGKGSDRPLNDENTRALQVAALECVDYVVLFSQDTPEEVIRRLRPQVHVKGGDYNPDTLAEKAAVEEGGGEIAFIPLLSGYSTTELLEKIRNH